MKVLTCLTTTTKGLAIAMAVGFYNREIIWHKTFRNQLTHTAIGTSPVDILAQANTYDTVVGVRLVNVASSAINVDAYIVNNSNNTYLIKNCPLPAGSSIELIDGELR